MKSIVQKQFKTVTFIAGEGRSVCVHKDDIERALEALNTPDPAPVLYHGDIVTTVALEVGMVLGRNTLANELFDKQYYNTRMADRVRVLLLDGHTTYTRYPSELTVISSPAYRKLLTVVA